MKPSTNERSDAPIKISLFARNEFDSTFRIEAFHVPWSIVLTCECLPIMMKDNRVVGINVDAVSTDLII